jgi:(p)ppGpp synthase/HD superfamily hydrolase
MNDSIDSADATQVNHVPGEGEDDLVICEIPSSSLLPEPPHPDFEKAKVSKNPHVVLNDRFFSAVAYAADAHKNQVRKSTNIAYICHPFGVAALVLEAHGDEDQAIAGLLHDVAEDCGGEPRLKDIEERFGPRVARIVRGCSDSLVASEGEKAPWKSRKEEHIAHLISADPDVLLVTAADKTHNARAIVTDLESHGQVVWSRFNAEPDEIIWYYESIYELLRKAHLSPTLLTPLSSAIKSMMALNL